MAIVKLNISGMHCSACSSTIETNLRKIPAITNIKINAISGRAKIAYDANQITEQQIIEAITSYGFPSSLDNAKVLEIAYIQGLKHRLYVAIPLFLMIFVLHMGGFPASAVLQLVLASVVQFYCGAPFYKGCKNFFVTKSADMNVLIALGTSVAYVYSLYLFVLGESGFYFEGSSAVICFVLVGEYLKARAKKQASDSMALLTTILPQKARLAQNGTWIEVDKIKKDDVCLVLCGEKIPLDGVVLEGRAEVSSAHLSGEELPRLVEGGAEVIGGSLVVNGELQVKATKDADAFFVHEMLDMLELAQSQKPPIGRLADRIASFFVPSVVLLSALAFVLWLILGKGLAFSLSIAAAVLVVSCPCALGLAVPLSIVCASMRAKAAQILIKSPDVYEKACAITTIVFDKTGTLTKGAIKVKASTLINGDAAQVYGIAKALQKNNPHPIAKAILEFTESYGDLDLESKTYEIAKGVKGVFQGESYYFGQLEWVESCANIVISKQESGIALAKNGVLLALFSLEDSLRENAKETLEALRKNGLKTIILSGDNAQSVAKVAESLGVSEYYAGVTPTQKAEFVAKLAQERGVVQGKNVQLQNCVCFVGDGINDALALKEASFGISLIEATQLAQEVGDVLLLKEDLWGIVEVFEIARATLGKIKENLFFAYVYNIVLIPIAAGILYPYFGIILQPAFAGAAMALSSISVVINALRISKLRLSHA